MAATAQIIQTYPGDTPTFTFKIITPSNTNPTFIDPAGSFVLTADLENGPDYLILQALSLTQGLFGKWSLIVQLTAAQTLLLPLGQIWYQARVADVDTLEITIATGRCKVLPIRPVN